MMVLVVMRMGGFIAAEKPLCSLCMMEISAQVNNGGQHEDGKSYCIWIGGSNLSPACGCGNRIETRCQEGKESQEEGEEAQIFLLKLRI
ncbi:MAG: hypothetical protein V8Q88_00135 [Christensenellales bacterium]